MVVAAAKPPTKDMSAMAAPAHTEYRDMLLDIYVYVHTHSGMCTIQNISEYES